MNINKIPYELCLVATSGDLSKNGMGDTNTVIPFDRKYKKSVDAFLKASVAYDVHTYNKNFFSNKKRNVYKKYLNTFRKLKDLGIFNSKYDFRTSWDMSFLDKDELQRYEPWKIETV